MRFANLQHLRSTLGRILFLSVVSLFLFTIIQGDVKPAYGQSTLLPESNDFATRVLRDPWDMNEFSDISQGLNNSGVTIDLNNTIVQNGLFTATTLTTDSQFYPLFPGYRVPDPNGVWRSAIKIGKLGSRYPIPSATYKCIYFAMYNNASAADYFQVLWFADDNYTAGPWGFSVPPPTTPSIWRLYSMNLSTSDGGGVGTTPWTGNALWQGLRVDPSILTGVNFTFDWIRLTDCNAVNYTLTWMPPGGGTVYLWVRPGGATRDIRITPDLGMPNDGSEVIDTQGLPPGQYTFKLSTSPTVCCTQTLTTITINQAPIVTFAKPSYTSGTDYATANGNTWDMMDITDTPVISCTNNTTFSNGILSFDTLSVLQQPPECRPGGFTDPHFHLNTPTPVSTTEYRYLSFRMNASGQWGNWANVDEAMIIRWIWIIQGTGGIGSECYVESWDMPFDIGWQIYWLDLANPFNGSKEMTSGSCPTSGSLDWSTVTPIKLRFDPNENISAFTMHQDIDWIRLTKMDSVTHGTPFPIQLSLNKSPQGIAFSYYYTNDLNNPTQSPALPYTLLPPPGPFRVFLPALLSNYAGGSDPPPVTNPVTFMWNTSAVTPSQYYICAIANDGINQVTYCSETPVQVN